ncbi:MAG: NAD(P)/FAD-dependent oxidoreductase [Candidatus Undinarchaeales archaeon]|nr:NAD(P)/FAD-dependent oxidoreductase [Candidatus Undinarchaeales archaeon]MDP7492887.1 NAD(P)/FAD-dependent oxidoreductase [Candidatus Undinarchaeales archaeon]
MDEYDVAIVGGGPAGLSLAADLSQDYNVALIERGEIGHTDKAWGVLETDGYRVDDDLVINRLYRGGIRLRSGERTLDIEEPMPAGDGCALVDEGKVMAKWRDQAESYGCNLLEKTSYRDLSYTDKGVEIDTDAGPLRARLVIDATGYNSPIAKKLGLNKEPDYYVPTYGGYVEGASFPDPTSGLVVVRDADTDVFGEYFPLSEERGVSWVFQTIKPDEYAAKSEDEWIQGLRDAYEDFASKDPEVAGSHLVKECYGVIPMRQMDRKAADRVLLVGDAGGQTPFCTLGFNSIFKGHERVAEQVGYLLEQDELDAISLNSISYREKNPLSDTLMPILIKQGIEMPVEEMMDLAEPLVKYGSSEAFSQIQVRALDDSLRLEDMESFFDATDKLPLRDKVRMAWGGAKAVGFVDSCKAAYAVGRAYMGHWFSDKEEDSE